MTVKKQITQLSGKDAKDDRTAQIEQRLEMSDKAHERVLEMIRTLQVREPCHTPICKTFLAKCPVPAPTERPGGDCVQLLPLRVRQ